MDYHVYLVLVVITLLQLCRAVITDTVPGTWISANTINDGYSPKPISELFSPPEPSPSFSPEHPIVVLSTLSALPPEPGVTYFSTTQAPFNSFSTSTPAPPSYTSSEPPSTIFSDPYSIPSLSQLDFSKTPSIAPQWSTTTALPNPSTEKPIQTLQQTLAISPLLPENQPTGPQNFAVVYENTPSPIQSLPSFPPQTSTEIPTVFTTTTTSSPLTSFSDGTITPYLPSRLPDPTSRPTVTFRSTPPSTTSRTTLFTRDIPETTRYLTTITEEPLRIVPGPADVPFKPSLRIRVVAPQGSITNVKINPTTTTKRPKTKKPKKNTYEACLDGCKVRREPICAIPLASLVIDPDSLKGFPSICHLACHNSYKKDAYEKLVDGRCGRLRTRIISVDTNSKIKKQELKKGEYSIINTGPKSVVEFARANNK